MHTWAKATDKHFYTNTIKYWTKSQNANKILITHAFAISSDYDCLVAKYIINNGEGVSLAPKMVKKLFIWIDIQNLCFRISECTSFKYIFHQFINFVVINYNKRWWKICYLRTFEKKSIYIDTQNCFDITAQNWTIKGWGKAFALNHYFWVCVFHIISWNSKNL